MGTPIDTSQVLKVAIEMEKEGYKFYTENAKKISDEAGRAMFQQLAKDELDHQKLFETEYDSLTRTGKWRSMKQLPDSAFLKSHVFPSAEKVKKSQQKPNELKALDIGLELERRSYEFYYGEAQRTNEPDAKAMLNHIAEIEKGHISILEAEKDYLTNTGYWFDYREITLE